jgi:hypothetical protein
MMVCHLRVAAADADGAPRAQAAAAAACSAAAAAAAAMQLAFAALRYISAKVQQLGPPTDDNLHTFQELIKVMRAVQMSV